MSELCMSVVYVQEDGTRAATEDPVLISDDDGAVDDDGLSTCQPSDSVFEPSSSLPANLPSPSYPAFCKAKRRSSVLPPARRSPVLLRQDADDDGVGLVDNAEMPPDDQQV